MELTRWLKKWGWASRATFGDTFTFSYVFKSLQPKDATLMAAAKKNIRPGANSVKCQGVGKFLGLPVIVRTLWHVSYPLGWWVLFPRCAQPVHVPELGFRRCTAMRVHPSFSPSRVPFSPSRALCLFSFLHLGHADIVITLMHIACPPTSLTHNVPSWQGFYFR